MCRKKIIALLTVFLSLATTGIATAITLTDQEQLGKNIFFDQNLLCTMALRSTIARAGAAAAASQYFPENVVRCAYVDATLLRYATGRNVL